MTAGGDGDGHLIWAAYLLPFDRILLGDLDADGIPVGPQDAVEVENAHAVAVSLGLPPTVVMTWHADGNRAGCHTFDRPEDPVFLLREPGVQRRPKAA